MTPDAIDATFDAAFDAACKEAVALIRKGRWGFAEYKLTRAALKVAQAVGDAESVELLDDLRYVKVGDYVAGGAR